MFTFGAPESENPNTHPVTATIRSDGLLLYVAEASYESGTSPLSSWIPIESYEATQQDESKMGDEDSARKMSKQAAGSGPLDVFERLV